MPDAMIESEIIVELVQAFDEKIAPHHQHNQTRE